MNITKIEQRIEAIKNAFLGDGNNVWILRESPDGCFHGPDPSEVHPKDIVLHFVAVEAMDGRGVTDAELEAKYPGRLERLLKTREEWAGKVLIPATQGDIDL